MNSVTDIIEKMLEAVRDVRAIPEMLESDVEKELQKRFIAILEGECE